MSKQDSAPSMPYGSGGSGERLIPASPRTPTVPTRPNLDPPHAPIKARITRRCTTRSQAPKPSRQPNETIKLIECKVCIEENEVSKTYCCKIG